MDDGALRVRFSENEFPWFALVFLGHKFRLQQLLWFVSVGTVLALSRVPSLYPTALFVFLPPGDVTCATPKHTQATVMSYRIKISAIDVRVSGSDPSSLLSRTAQQPSWYQHRGCDKSLRAVLSLV